MKRAWLPLLVFVLLMAFLGVGLTLNPREVPSPLIGKQAPEFTLSRVANASETLSSASLKNQVWLLNVWASWCGACRQEHQVLTDLARSGAVPIYGLNHKDKRDNAQRWLERFGNPYAESFYDPDGHVGIDFGVYGVPETFLIDADGTILYKHAGPVTPELLDETILPLVRKRNG
ncbi:MAG TPA: DsbE family thiol:disulfide interchange protein [Burkholderiaceae bacterium]|nr:DsbE family thiol:disulfide interchange protein [Burkholderiaceae bacterium]